MIKKGAIQKPEDAVSLEEEIKDPFVLEFLGLKDEYSESDLEGALIQQLEDFLLELGSDLRLSPSIPQNQAMARETRRQ